MAMINCASIQLQLHYNFDNNVVNVAQSPIKGVSEQYDPHNYDELYAPQYGGFGESRGGYGGDRYRAMGGNGRMMSGSGGGGGSGGGSGGSGATRGSSRGRSGNRQRGGSSSSSNFTVPRVQKI